MSRLFSLFLLAPLLCVELAGAQQLGNTKPLIHEGDIASDLVAGVDRFLLRQLESTITARSRYWDRDTSSAEAYNKSVAGNRERLAEITGVVDSRRKFADLSVLAGTVGPVEAAKSDLFTAYNVQWPSVRNITGVGLLLKPAQPNGAFIIALPDADQTPEMISGLAEGIPPVQQFARRFAESGFTVIVPAIISREYAARNNRAKMTTREFLYRSSFELGRHLIGFEIQKVLAAVDWCESRSPQGVDVAVVGYGEGGLLALYSAALDTRIDVTLVSGYFDSRQQMWSEPVSRNVHAFLDQFGDAELATMIAPRRLVIEAAKGPEFELKSEGGAPAVLDTPDPKVVTAEVERARDLIGADSLTNIELIVSGDGHGGFASSAALNAVASIIDADVRIAKVGPAPKLCKEATDVKAREAQQTHEIGSHTQWLLTESHFIRQEFFKDLDTSSLEAYEKTIEPYRDYFRHETIGHFDLPLKAMNPRTRLVEESNKWTRYEVVLDVFDDVIAYGLITIPKGIEKDEQRPVVVCQHGLEGRPQDVIGEKSSQYYSAFATKLAERGFITFAPQNLYIFTDRFRSLQRKSYPQRKTLFSTIVPQHQQIVNWLKTLGYVDGDRIAFYGLSYGGKSAMRIPPLVADYCLSICSADFNEWVLKNATTQYNFSYMFTGEYEIFEWNLGGTFNYAEMAYLICPRPFMVERGHFDGVGKDQWVGYEFGRVRFMYQGLLKLQDKTEIEWFDGPHKINGVGTFRFLEKHLDWQVPE
ncbi:MAG: dienelactone hydrolase family protein [Planctomycetaceae bacterium]